jgi:hypothetical protein
MFYFHDTIKYNSVFQKFKKIVWNRDSNIKSYTSPPSLSGLLLQAL